MKRIFFDALLATGLVLMASGSAFAQRHGGFSSGPPGGGNGGHEQAFQGGTEHAAVAPGVRSESPAVRTNQPALGGERGEHPFYGNDRHGENDWRYQFNEGRWWYWTPLGAWAYWNDGRWADYSGVPHTTNYRGPSAPVGWYWNDSQKRYYWFDGSSLTAAPQ